MRRHHRYAYSSGGRSSSGNLTILSLLFWIVVATAPFGIMYFIGWQADVRLNTGVVGYLKNAADANTIDLASRELGKAVRAIESKGWTKGHSHAFYFTRECDIGYWYENLKSAHTELAEFKNSSQEASREEINTQLIKLRETLLDDSSEGVTVTVPPNMCYYPNQSGMVLAEIISSAWLIGFLLFGSIWAKATE